MKAVLFHEHGGADKLSYEERPMPQLGPQEVLVRVKACALNHLDVWVRQGIPAYSISLPHIGGSDVSGIIEQVGTQGESVCIGAEVFVSPGISCWQCEYCLSGRDNLCRSYHLLGTKTPGGYAEYVKVPFRNVLPIPANLSFEQAAAFPLVSVTASHMLFALAGLQHGETVLVMGAGSGVGMMAIHPAQIETINEGFTPSAEEVDFARQVVDLFAANPGAATLALNGKMLDRPHYLQARRLLDRVH